MNKLLNSLKKGLKTRLGFVLLLVGIYWLKSIWAYYIDFDLDMKGFYQNMLAFINPIPFGLLLIGASLYIRKTKVFYGFAFAIYFILFSWLFSNAIYYREFSDFITISTMMATSSVSAGLGEAALKLFRIWDLVYLLDFIIFGVLLVKKMVVLDKKAFPIRQSFAITALSVMLASANLFLAEIDRPELLSRGFSNTYIVRALGLPAFLGYNANQTYKAHQDRSGATAEDLVPVQEYISEHYAAPNDQYFGIAKGRNVIYIHLESLQQFVIDYKLNVDGVDYEVTPFLNSLYHSSSTLAFSNFFNQVKAGKTSDAETMIETSLFGLNQGSFMVQYGGTNTQQAAPHILAQNGGYSSAVFHGNAGSFWNRNNTYKQWGYNYFFDQSYFTEQTDENSFQYGLNDKIMLADSIEYLEHMQQPFYAKYITVSNHYPYTTSLIGDEIGFPLAQTDDETINGYFATANYLDSSIEAFFNYLKATGLYEKSVIVLYGDHYGISNSRNPDLAPLIGKDSETWSDYDNAMLQRVPYMVVIPGMTTGKIIDTYGGEIDALPTLEHLLGIEANNFLQVGQDLLSPENDQVVAMRTSGTFISPKYTSYAGKLYYTETGEEITNPDETTIAEVEALKAAAAAQLAASDAIQTGDLIRFFDNGLPTVDTSQFSYLNSLEAELAIEKALGNQSTSLYSQNGNQSTVNLFKAPSYQELHSSTSASSSTSTSTSTTTSTSSTSGE
ncbi:LTA synthase family protein [Streptococcus sp. 29896]|uniref:LTA synthase family protein n=1 Tax=Streptococcus suivaginalis TaxID=3028082 RepID=A0AA96ZYE9_9STRE|nr:LTA synthase family protein [Streptococcus sp. 29896]WNY46307.1 LTA synthase family protein [Streptococcus sp. 29896]